MDLNEENKLFSKLSERKKVIRIERGLNDLIKAGRLQMELLKKYKNSSSQKEIGFLYFFKTVESTWENIMFSKHIGKGKYKHLNFFPARLVCENIFRIEYYISQNTEGQNEICFWEMARVMKKFYDELGDTEFRKYYNAMIDDFGEQGLSYPDILKKDAYRDPFPRIKNMISESKLPSVEGFYIHYSYLCESHHGKLISLFIKENSIRAYRQNLFYIFLFSRWLLILTDAHIKFATKSDINETITSANKKVFSN